MRKAKIDVLDIADSFEVVTPDTLSSEPSPGEPQIDLHGESFLAVQAEGSSGKRFSVKWKRLLLFGGAFLVLLLIAASVYYFVFYDEKAADGKVKTEKNVPVTAVIGAVDFPNMRTVITDLQGKQRVILFGFAVTPGKAVPLNLTAEDRELRAAAAHIVGGMSLSELIQDKGRDQVKKKIKAHIEELKGSGAVGDVWITSWTIL